MKSFIKIAFLALSGVVSATAFAQNAPAGQAAAADKSASTCGADCSSMCHWNMPHFKDWYTDVYGMYSTAHKFHGWGVGVRFGKLFNREDTLEVDHKGHAFEFELAWIYECAYASKSQNKVAGTTSTSASSGYVSEKREVEVDMFPLMFNYRYHGSMAGWSECKWLERMRWSLGAGLGFNIFHYDDSVCQEDWEPVSKGGKIQGSRSKSTSNTSIKLAAQLFGDIRYACTERVEIFTGLRGFFTDDHKFGDNSLTPLKVGKVHGIWDFGVNWMW